MNKLKIKKIVSMLLCCLLTATAFVAEDPQAVAFAAENNADGDQPAELQKTTLEVTIEPGEESVIQPGISPQMWDQATDQSTKSALYMVPFVIPDRYFAYEMSATGASGNYSVTLLYDSTSTIAIKSGVVNNGTYKMDWVEVTPKETYQFKVSNFTGGTIVIKLTYYSWK